MSTFLLIITWSISITLLLSSMGAFDWISENVLGNPGERYKGKIRELEQRIEILENRKAESENGK